MAELNCQMHVKTATDYDDIYLTSKSQLVEYDNTISGLSATDTKGAIDELASEKLDKVGDAKDTTVTFTEAVTLANVVSGESQATLWGKIKKFFSFIGTTTLTTTAQTITTAINELNTNLSRNFLNSSKNFKQVKMECGQPLATFTAGVATITLSQSYADGVVVANVLGAIVSNSTLGGTTMTISGTSVNGVALSGQYYVKYHVVGY